MGEVILPVSASGRSESIARWLCILLMCPAMLLPHLHFAESMPGVHLSELLLPVIGILLLIDFRKNVAGSLRIVLLIQGVLATVMLLSIAVNHRFGMYRDYFELFKVVKYCILVVFFTQFIQFVNLNSIMKVTMSLLLVFNVLHYTDLFGFNDLVVSHYGSEHQVYTFGLNSLGQPDTKRIIGTVGNPNNNAILFLFFTVWFFPSAGQTVKEKMWYYLSLLAVIACQSRTGFIALGIVFTAGNIVRGNAIKSWLLDLVVIALMFAFLFLLGNVYLSSLAGNMMKQNSVRGRLETWQFLGNMIAQKPWLGYAPSKEYFEANTLYAENEYILYTWRFGIAGGLLYSVWLGYSFVKSYVQRMTHSGFVLLLFSTVVGITALTNCPLSDGFLLLLFAIATGYFYNRSNLANGL
jgi:O-antigen ligase